MFLYGASGHGKVIKEILESNDDFVDAFIDDNVHLSSYCGKDVLHEVDVNCKLIVSIGNNRIRADIVSRLSNSFGVAIAPSAIVSPSAQIGEGTVVMPGAIINADAVIGKHCIINTGASVDHECVISDFAHIAPHATLCGQVHVGVGTLVGVGACVIPCKCIGSWSVVGAGAVITNDVPSNCTAVGVPASIIKKFCVSVVDSCV